jgi:hypothetical protein
MSSCREHVGRTLSGDVLEIGAGSAPFPTAPGARVRFADRLQPESVAELFPELAGSPPGPAPDLLIDLDADGLRPLPDRCFDVVIASHVLEHLAAPIAALVEFGRVLRPGGRLVLVLPDRTRTFDAVRLPTPLAHLLAEHGAGVRSVSDEHIREFHLSTTAQPPVALEDQDGVEVNPDLIELHRRRSIHVHCWTPEEMAAALIGLTAAGLMRWSLADMFLPDDDEPTNEFGLVLRATTDESAPVDARGAALRLTEDWCRLVIAVPARDPQRLGWLTAALDRDIDGPHRDPIVAKPVQILAERITEQRRELDALRAQVDAITGSAATATVAMSESNDRAPTAGAVDSPVEQTRRSRRIRTWR